MRKPEAEKARINSLRLHEEYEKNYIIVFGGTPDSRIINQYHSTILYDIRSNSTNCTKIMLSMSIIAFISFYC